MSVDPLEHRTALFDELLHDAASPAPHSRLLRTAEVAALFHVSERAVTDWAQRGRLPSLRTPGGHRRYPAEAVMALVESHACEPVR